MSTTTTTTTTSTTVPETIAIQPAIISDVPALSRIQAAAFRSDLVSHIMTLDRPDDWSYEDWLERTTAPSFQDPDVTFVKAVERSADRIVGWACWAVKDDLQRVDDDGGVGSEGGERSECANGNEEQRVPAPAKGPVNAPPVSAPSAGPPPKPLLPRQVLSSLLAGDATAQYAKHMLSSSPSSQPPIPGGSDGRHLVLEGLFVHPAHQGRGIGRALLERFSLVADGRDGNDNSNDGRETRDRDDGNRGAQVQVQAQARKCWVHASPASWRLYERVGFKEVGKWQVDLGEVMRRGEGSGWGVYAFRYMVRERKGESV